VCVDLKTWYGLKPSRRMCVIEKVNMFLFTLVMSASNRKDHERFQYSGEIMSRYFNEVLGSVCLLAVEIIKLVDPDFLTTPREITMNPRYMSCFKVTLKLFNDLIIKLQQNKLYQLCFN
jgi:hypothetical protein